jgi:hypothetical protein
MDFADFAEQIKKLAVLLDKNKDKVTNEEATKMALVMPFLKVLGYDIHDPNEIIPEYTADVGDKKGEKIDFAIAKDSQVVLLIEVKSIKSILDPRDIYQLVRYFDVENVKFAILTNGIQYQFYTDFERTHRMDKQPFYSVKLDKNIRDSEIKILHLFSKSKFNISQIIVKAHEIKYTGEIKDYLEKQVTAPEEEFIKFFMRKTNYPGPFYKKSIEQYSPIVSRAFKLYVNQLAKNTHQSGENIISGPVIIEKLRDNLRKEFWTQLLGYSKTKTELHSRISPGQDSWCGMGAGTSGLGYNYVIFQHKTRVELYIDKGNQTQNKEIFDGLAATKGEIEQNFGESLEWERMDEKRACRIKKDLPLGGYRDDEQNWPKVHEAMVDAMIRFHKALSPHIKYLRK